MKNILWIWISVFLALGGAGCDEEIDSTEDPDGGDDGTDNDIPPGPKTDVCRFETPVTLGAPEEDGMVVVPPDHPAIWYMGRVDCSDPSAPSFAFPGVSIRTRFEGGALDMLFDDNGSGARTNYYNIVIDGGAPVVLEMIPGENRYALARNLSDGEHTVEVFKRVESNGNAGRGAFLGFRIPAGTDLSPVTPKPYRLEAVGNSITCGYGNEVSVTDPDNYKYTTQNSNAYNAWTAIAARDLNAEYLAVAYSGRGVYRNYSGGSGETLPEMYLDTLPDDPDAAPWEVTRFTPDVLVINLGTNDFSPGIDEAALDEASQTYELAMLAFVETLRGYYPDAAIILSVGTMLSNSYPSGYNAFTRVTDSLTAVVATRAAAGDPKVHLLELGMQSSPYGEDWHPTVATHMDMAGKLMDLVDSLGLMM